MLQEYGSQRPTVFEVLHNVHSMRGTKSAYSYSLPTLKTLALRNSDFKSNPLDGIVTYRQSTAQIAPKVQSTKAPELLVPPERRGRPKSATGPVSLLPFPSMNPATDAHIDKIKLVDDSGAHCNAAWSSAIAEQASLTVQNDSNGGEPWGTSKGMDKIAKLSPLSSHAGFDDNFAQRLWASTASSIVSQSSVPTPSSKSRICSPKLDLPHHETPSSDFLKSKHDSNIQANQGKDAFEGLGLMLPSSKPVPTLGEARKLRTGLATMSVNISRPVRPSPSPRLRPKVHTQRVSPIPPARSSEADISSPSSRSPIQRVSSPAQTKFPTLEELDATLGVSSLDRHNNRVILPAHEPPALSSQPKTGSLETGVHNGLQLLRPSLADAGGARSEQVTGLRMRESAGDSPKELKEEDLLSFKTDNRDERNSSGLLQFPSFNLSRTQLQKEKSSQSTVGSGDIKSRNIANSRLPANRSRDLLTGDDELDLSRQIFDSKPERDTLKIREAPRKRASVIERNDTFEATIPQQGHTPDPSASIFPLTSNRSAATNLESPTSCFMKELPVTGRSATATYPSSGLTDNWSPIATTGSHVTANERELKDIASDLSSSEDEGPEEPAPLASLPLRVAAEAFAKHKNRQGSVHNLVDLWEGGASNTKDQQHEPQVPLKQTIKPRSAYMPQPRSPSPQRKPLPSVSSNPSHSIISSRVDFPSQLSTSSPSSSWSQSIRIRPQSMFMFPSNSAENSALSSAALQPPEDTAPRSVRRTSISDMVQRYEALEASTRVTGNSTTLSPISPTKPLPSREYFQDPSAVQLARTSPEKAPIALSGFSAAAVTSPVKRRTSLTVLPRPGSSRSQRISPAPHDASRSTSLEESEVETILPRSRNSSTLVSESTKFPVASRKAVIGGERSMRQTQLEPPTSTCYPTNERPSSPERPYQGVGKLIDQWQRKSAEAEASRNVVLSKRTGLAPPKQAGLVPAHGKGM